MTLVLIASAITFTSLGYRMKSWQVIGYAFASVLVLSVLLFVQDNSNVKVTTPYVTIEKEVRDLAVTQKQLQDTVTTLTEMILVTEDGVGKFADGKPQRDKLIHRLQDKLKSQIPAEELRDLNRNLETVNQSH